MDSNGPTSKTESEMPPIVALGGAKEFFSAARMLTQSKNWLPSPTQDPAYTLYFHSLELALKAFLRYRQVPTDELRRHELGHDISALLERSIVEGLALSPELLAHIRTLAGILNEANRYQGLRYWNGGGDIPNPDWTTETIEQLLSAVTARVIPAPEPGKALVPDGIAITVMRLVGPEDFGLEGGLEKGA